MNATEKKKTDEALVALAQGGDKSATEELLLRYTGLVRVCARGFFLVGGETEDLIQEGMIGLYNAIIDFKPRSEDGKEGGKSFKNFAGMCITRRIIDAVKSSARKKNQPLNYYPSSLDYEWAGTDLNPEDMIILNDDRREFKQKMSKVLSDFEFKVTTMYVEGMSCDEICDATGKPTKSVDNAIQRSKRKLQQILKK